MLRLSGVLGLFAVLAIAAQILLVYIGRNRADDDPGVSFPGSTAVLPVTSEAEPQPAGDASGLPSGALPGSMRATLITAGTDERSHVFALAIRDGGHACGRVIDGRAVGTSGSVWRARCEGGAAFWILVDEFDRLSVEPVPYGDLYPGSPQTVPGAGIDRTERIILAPDEP